MTPTTTIMNVACQRLRPPRNRGDDRHPACAAVAEIAGVAQSPRAEAIAWLTERLDWEDRADQLRRPGDS